MDIQTTTYYRQQLTEYLKSTKLYRHADAEKLQRMVSAIEQDLKAVILSVMHIELREVYEYLDKEALQNLISETNRGKSLAAQNEQSGGLLRESMNFYLGYLNSKKHPLAEKETKRQKAAKKPAEAKPTAPPTEPEPEPEAYDKLEGAKHEATVTRYERDRDNRRKCIAHYGYVCQVCGMNFEKVYGELGKDFIEVHHLHPVSQGQRTVNPIEDLVPLCSNCHSMIHRQADVSDWQGLREKYLSHSTNKKDHEEESD